MGIFTPTPSPSSGALTSGYNYPQRILYGQHVQFGTHPEYGLQVPAFTGRAALSVGALPAAPVPMAGSFTPS